MICKIEIKPLDEIKATNILPQTSYWAKVKNKQGYIPKSFQINISKDILNPSSNNQNIIKDDLLILIKYLNSNECFAYVPYGPKLEPYFENQGVFLEELSENIRAFLPDNCIFIRYDLLWENQWSNEEEYFDNRGNWIGPPESQTQEFRLNFNTTNWNLHKSPIDVLPKNTFFLDLTKSEKDLLYNMRFNTRYNIRQAIKKGVKVKEYGIEKLDEWYDLYVETAIRNNMVINDKNYFSIILKNQDNYQNGVHVNLLMAEYKNEILASMFLILSKTRAFYLFGASATQKNNTSASYLLQWEAINKAKKYGCTEYDMFGCAPNLYHGHPLHGVHIYKKGFGGSIYHRMGCWDYPYQKEQYEIIKTYEVKTAIQGTNKHVL